LISPQLATIGLRAAIPASAPPGLLDNINSGGCMRTSAMVRLGIMVVILIGLTIPIAMIYAVVWDRSSRRDEATNEVGQEWGQAQTLAGTVLTIPYRMPGAMHKAR
jgi:hypothetical protein